MAETIEEYKSSRRLGRTNTKCLCPICNDVKQARQNNLEETITLECKHQRDVSLPPRPGHIGIEETDDRNPRYPILKRLFPVLPDTMLDKEWNEYISSFVANKA